MVDHGDVTIRRVEVLRRIAKHEQREGHSQDYADDLHGRHDGKPYQPCGGSLGTLALHLRVQFPAHRSKIHDRTPLQSRQAQEVSAGGTRLPPSPRDYRLSARRGMLTIERWCIERVILKSPI